MSHLTNDILSINEATPRISVLGNTGQCVRQLTYYRSEMGIEASLHIGLQRYNEQGRIKALFDPRLAMNYLEKPHAAIANYKQRTSLSGTILETHSVDVGMQTAVHDVRGKLLYSIDSRDNEHIYEYDEGGRLVACYEQSQQEEKKCCIESFNYGDQNTKAINGINRLLYHTDSAGLEEIKNYSFQGQVLSQHRYFAENESSFEDRGYESQWQYNALGEMLTQTDAEGNRRGVVFDVAGQVATNTLQLNHQQEKTVLAEALDYRANGQLLRENLANGVVITYAYEATTQRLCRLEAIRLRDNKQLYDLYYQYDPVGNVITVDDRSKTSGFYANQQTASVNQYIYDSFYQLIEATGIQSQQAGKETPRLPDVMPLGNSDTSQCVNYVRRYHYDASGNLSAMQHTSAQRYTKKFIVDTNSNRSIEEGNAKRKTLQQSFDGNGNVLYLDVGQPPLKWDHQNQLKKVTQLKREKTSDEECYVYDGNHQRLEKRTVRLAKNQIHTERVRYLPGLEIRDSWQTDLEGNDKKITEVLHVIHGQVGRHVVRVLHWQQGQPEAMGNDSFRLTLTEVFNTCQFELNEKADVVSYESYYPYGGTAIWATKQQSEVKYKFIRYSGKEKDSTGLYYYGYRYYSPWLGRWLNPDPSGIADGLNLFKMLGNNPISFYDDDGRARKKLKELYPSEQKIIDDPVTGMPKAVSFRTIRKVFEGKDTEQQVNVTAWFEGIEKVINIKSGARTIRKKETGQEFYLLTGEKPAKRLIVSAHGNFSPATQPSEIPLTSESPIINIKGPHGKPLVSDVKESIKFTYATISAEGISATSSEAEKELEEAGGYVKLTGTKTKSAIHNYNLTKFKEADLFDVNTLETYATIVNDLNATENPIDILTIRKKAGGFGVTLNDVIALAQRRDYKELICSFCRGGPNFEGTFILENITPIKPIMKMYNELE